MSLYSPIIITGGAGFIGSNLVRFYNEIHPDIPIYIFDDLGKDQKWKNLVGLRFEDLIHYDQIFHLLPKIRPSIVYHLGACSSTTEQDAEYLAENNYRYSQRLTDVFYQMRRADSVRLPILKSGFASLAARFGDSRDLPRFVYASSAATYGMGEAGFCEDVGFSALQPLNMYGFSKHMFDLYAHKKGLFKRVYCVGLKYFNVYGPNEEHKEEMRSVVSKAFQAVRNDAKIQLFESNHLDYKHGEQSRDFVYVKDAVFLTYILGHMPHRIGGLFNIGSGMAQTFNQLATEVFKALGRKLSIEYVPMPPLVRANYQNFTEADVTKTKNEIARLFDESYVPPNWLNQSYLGIFPLQLGIQDYIHNHLIKPEQPIMPYEAFSSLLQVDQTDGLVSFV